MYKRNCRICKNDFEADNSHLKICKSCKEEKLRIKLERNNPNLGRIHIRHLQSICKECNNTFWHKDVKAKICLDCKEKTEVICQCGCNKNFTMPKFKYKRTPYYRSHKNRGKSYLEIYGTKNPSCGYQKGNLNLMANREILEKLLLKGKKENITEDNLYFCNNDELYVYKWLKEKYKNKTTELKYEYILELPDKTLSVPDFVIMKDNKLLEIYETSGYGSAYEKGRIRNYKKIMKYVKKYEFPKSINTIDYKTIEIIYKGK